MNDIDPVEIVKSLIAECVGYVAFGTTLSVSPPLENDHFKKLAEKVKADNAVGEVFRDEEGNTGWPFLSFAQVAFDKTVPILLVSGLSDHTRNIIVDNRVSLLIDGTISSNRMNSARAALFGRANLVDKEQYREIYIAKHPKAEAYFDFGDFNAYVVDVTHIRLNAGFGKAFWLDGADI